MKVDKVGKILRARATHHDHGEGWTYSRDLYGMKHIRYARDWKGWNRLGERVKRAATSLIGRSRGTFAPHGLRERWAYAKVALRTENNLPDGALNQGIVITVWEEDGEYIECVGPTIGEKLADFLESEPDHPHAVAIAAEIERVWALSRARRASSDCDTP